MKRKIVIVIVIVLNALSIYSQNSNVKIRDCELILNTKKDSIIVSFVTTNFKNIEVIYCSIEYFDSNNKKLVLDYNLDFNMSNNIFKIKLKACNNIGEISFKMKAPTDFIKFGASYLYINDLNGRYSNKSFFKN